MSTTLKKPKLTIAQLIFSNTHLHNIEIVKNTAIKKYEYPNRIAYEFLDGSKLYTLNDKLIGCDI